MSPVGENGEKLKNRGQKEALVQASMNKGNGMNNGMENEMLLRNLGVSEQPDTMAAIEDAETRHKDETHNSQFC